MNDDDDLNDFEQFMTRRENAARAYVNGDAGSLMDLVTHVSPATFFSPQGNHRQGAAEVASTYRQDVDMFQAGGDTELEILHMAASGDLAYWTGIQHATVRMRDNGEPTPMALRVTEIFRREDGDWKLIHRHADALAPAKSHAVEHIASRHAVIP